MADVRIFSQTRDGTRLGEFPLLPTLKWSHMLNRPGACSFDLALDYPLANLAYLNPGVVEIGVMRDNEVVWTGPILTIREKNKETVTISCEGILSYFKRNFITSDLTYTNTDQFTIFKNLIAHQQGKTYGSWGVVTSGVTTSGITRTYTAQASEHKNIYDELVKLAEQERGFDFEIGVDRVLSCYYPQRGTTRRDVIMDEGTITDFERSYDVTAQASEVIGEGNGDGDAKISYTHSTTAAEAVYGLTQYLYTSTEDKVLANLTDKVKKQFSYRSTPPQSFDLTVSASVVSPGDLTLGDEVRVKWDSPFDPVNKYLKLLGYEVFYEEGSEKMRLTFQTLDEELA